MLVIDNPLEDPESNKMKILSVLDTIHTILFSIEALIRIIALGFVTNKLKNPQLKPYLHSTWNILDFFVVTVSLIELLSPLFASAGSQESSSLQGLKALRALRALRPLRMISRNEGMKLVVDALFASVPSMTNVLLVCMLLLLIMAIMGVNFFKGKFFSCQGLTTE